MGGRRLGLAIVLLGTTATVVAENSAADEFAWAMPGQTGPEATSTLFDLVAQPPDQPGDDLPEVETIPPFGTEGSWRWAIYGGAAVDINDDAEQYNAHWAASYFIVDGFSVDFEFGGLYFDQGDGRGENDAFGGNFNILFRWHFLMEEDWSLYVDGGAGVLLASEEVPPHGTNFNFTPQAGIGASFEIGNNARLMTGVRWHHISNARTVSASDNPGRDSAMFYAGVSFPF